MSNIVAMKAFFATLGDVVDNLIDMFPDDADFRTFKTFIGMIQKANPSLVINTFYEELSKFEKYIDAKDEKFLLEYKAVDYGAEGADILGHVQKAKKDKNKKVDTDKVKYLEHSQKAS